jgi:Family of unknown function (DUF6941)
LPELDYALLADFVRVDGGVASVIGGGIDTVYASDVPAAHNFGLLARITFTRGECDRPHRIEIFFRDTDGQDIAKLEATTIPKWDDTLPPDWLVGALMGLNFGLPLPVFGLYAFEIMIDDRSAKTLNLRVVERHVDAP